MVAKIGRGKSLFGALQYNQLKVSRNEGQVLYTHKVPDTIDGSHSVTNFAHAFEPYLIANRRTEKPVLHISLNPDPKDNVSDARFSQLAKDYMRKMGYGDQPFAVFKHTDIDRSHIHIVSVCVDGEGKKISDKFEHNRSMAVCRELEKKYGLTPATEKGKTQNDKVFRPVNYCAGDLKSQLASVVRYLPNHYRFQTFGEYNALLSLFNITAEKVEGVLHGQQRRGLVYFALDENGKKASNPFKASLFGKYAGFARLQKHMEESKEKLKTSEAKPRIKEAVTAAIKSVGDEAGFRQHLDKVGINTVVRRNTEGRIYGVTFIDHQSKTVWNGSRLGKECSAGVFHEWWNNGKRSEENRPNNMAIPDLSGDNPHGFFDFLNNPEPDFRQDTVETFSGITWLFPEAQGEDYEELDFAYRMKKRKKKKR